MSNKLFRILSDNPLITDQCLTARRSELIFKTQFITSDNPFQRLCSIGSRHQIDDRVVKCRTSGRTLIKIERSKRPSNLWQLELAEN